MISHCSVLLTGHIGIAVQPKSSICQLQCALKLLLEDLGSANTSPSSNAIGLNLFTNRDCITHIKSIALLTLRSHIVQCCQRVGLGPLCCPNHRSANCNAHSNCFSRAWVVPTQAHRPTKLIDITPDIDRDCRIHINTIASL